MLQLQECHASYGLNGKVVATITDNGSNFVQCIQFHHQSLQCQKLKMKMNAFLKTWMSCYKLIMEKQKTLYTQLQYKLPPHKRCAAHTLNLVASTDIDKYISSSSESRNTYRSSFAKSAALWNRSSRSMVAADQVEQIAKRKLLVPTCTRWNSHYDAVVRLTENSTTELNERVLHWRFVALDNLFEGILCCTQATG